VSVSVFWRISAQMFILMSFCSGVRSLGTIFENIFFMFKLLRKIYRTVSLSMLINSTTARMLRRRFCRAMNGGDRTSQYHTVLAFAKFTGNRKKIKFGYFIATPRTALNKTSIQSQYPYFLHQFLRDWTPQCLKSKHDDSSTLVHNEWLKHLLQ
jgi:hypothetical protein